MVMGKAYHIVTCYDAPEPKTIDQRYVSQASSFPFLPGMKENTNTYINLYIFIITQPLALGCKIN